MWNFIIYLNYVGFWEILKISDWLNIIDIVFVEYEL